MRALLTGPGYTPDHVARLEQMGYDVVQREALERSELLSLIGSLEAYVLGGDERLDAEALGRAERLRGISFVGTGFGDFVDVTAAARHDIEIRNTPGVASPAVAEHTIGLLLGTLRKLFAHNDAVKRNGDPAGSTSELANATVGIVGLGDIGTRVARILRTAFGTNVVYASRTRKPALEQELGLEALDLRKLFARADVVVLLASITPETIEMIGADVLEASKPGLILINTAGARLVDPAALREALERGTVAAAAFDSYWIEPPPPVAEDPHGLLALPDARFVLTPHVAAKTDGTWSRMVDQAIANLADFAPDAR